MPPTTSGSGCCSGSGRSGSTSTPTPPEARSATRDDKDPAPYRPGSFSCSRISRARTPGIRRWGAYRGWRPSSCGRGACGRSCPWCPPQRGTGSQVGCQSASLSQKSGPGCQSALSPRQDGAMKTGQSATLEFEVTDADTAVAVGSGDLAVLGTPRLLAWCEAATCAAIEESLDEGRTSVGTRVSLEHLAASPVGERVEVHASVAYVDGRLVRFTVAASHVADG